MGALQQVGANWMIGNAIIDKADRLAAAHEGFGDVVRLTEPYAVRPPLWIEPATEALRSKPAAVARWMTEIASGNRFWPS